jgi:hypothetical protein
MKLWANWRYFVLPRSLNCRRSFLQNDSILSPSPSRMTRRLASMCKPWRMMRMAWLRTRSESRRHSSEQNPVSVWKNKIIMIPSKNISHLSECLRQTQRCNCYGTTACESNLFQVCIRWVFHPYGFRSSRQTSHCMHSVCCSPTPRLVLPSAQHKTNGRSRNLDWSIGRWLEEDALLSPLTWL